MTLTPKISSLLALFILSFIALFIYEINTYEPDDNFYKQEYEKVTLQPFPKAGQIIHKYSTYPDSHGDYESCILINVTNDEYQRLEKLIDTNYPKEFNNVAATCFADWAPEVGKLSKQNISTKQGGHVSKWGLVQGKTHVFILFYSW